MILIIRLLIAVLILSPLSASAYIDLPKDAEGWTVFTPSTDSRIMYVSADGNNTTGRIYVRSGGDNTTTFDHPDWEHPQNPTGTINAFATYQAAIVKGRAGYPDWVLMKRGDTFTDQTIDAWVNNGKSATEPALVGAYGSSGLSPIFKVSSASGIRNDGIDRFVAFSGLHFYAYKRDPANPSYDVNADAIAGISYFSNGSTSNFDNILFEGCKFSFLEEGGAITSSTGSTHDLKIRRNIFLDSYSNTSSRAQGLWVGGGGDNIQITENIFDHNGWYEPTGGLGEAVNTNHSTYLSLPNNMLVEGNVSMRPSSIHFKFTSGYPASSGPVTVRNNLMIDGKIGISLGGNGTGEYRFHDALVENNVITGMNVTQTTTDNIAWGIDLEDWDGGTVRNNIIAHIDSGGSHAIGHIGVSRNVSITGNVVYDFKNIDRALHLDEPATVTNCVFSNNKISVPTDSGYTITTIGTTATGWTFSGNRYYSDQSDPLRFTLAGVNSTFAQWQTATGDDSVFENTGFYDSTRSIETYMVSIGETDTVAAFIALARAQDRYDWDTRIVADPVNDFIREGFFGPYHHGNLRIGNLTPRTGNGWMRD